MSERQEAIRKVVAAYKLVLGMERDSERWKAWDKFQFARNAKAASSVLAAFEGNLERAVAWVVFKGNEWKDAGLSFTLETIARHGWDSGAIFDGRETGEMGRLGLSGSTGDSAASQLGIEAAPAEENLGNGPEFHAVERLVRSIPTDPILGPSSKIPRIRQGTKDD